MPADAPFLLLQLDKLLSLSESILVTSFHNESVDEVEAECSFEFSDNLYNSSLLRQIENYLLNLRQLVAILLTLFEN